MGRATRQLIPDMAGSTGSTGSTIYLHEEMVHETFAAHLVNLREKLAEDCTGSRQLVPVQYFAHFHLDFIPDIPGFCLLGIKRHGRPRLCFVGLVSDRTGSKMVHQSQQDRVPICSYTHIIWFAMWPLL